MLHSPSRLKKSNLSYPACSAVCKLIVKSSTASNLESA